MKSTGYTEGVMGGDVGWVRDTTPTQFATVLLTFEDGCDATQGEYGQAITGLIGHWTKDDIDLIWECIENDFDLSKAPKEGWAELFLEEDGEWGGFPHWHKYFTIKHVKVSP